MFDCQFAHEGPFFQAVFTFDAGNEIIQDILNIVLYIKSSVASPIFGGIQEELRFPTIIYPINIRQYSLKQNGVLPGLKGLKSRPF